MSLGGRRGKTKRLLFITSPINDEPSQPTDFALSPSCKTVRIIELCTQGCNLCMEIGIFGL
jgi:hypothetical protein